MQKLSEIIAKQKKEQSKVAYLKQKRERYLESRSSLYTNPHAVVRPKTNQPKTENIPHQLKSNNFLKREAESAELPTNRKCKQEVHKAYWNWPQQSQDAFTQADEKIKVPIKAKTSTSWQQRPKATSSFVLPNYAPPQTHDFSHSRHNKQPRPAKIVKQTRPVIINMNEGLTLISGNLQKPQTEDPFDRVIVSSHIDNALFTSGRTMTGLNNTLSQSLKVCHNKFSFSSVAKSNYKLYPEPAKSAEPAEPAEPA